MKTVAIIQARMGSTRLPGKVLKDLCGQSVLAHVVHRVAATAQVDEIVVATTDDPIDEAIVRAGSDLGIAVYRGSESDVLARYFGAAQQHQADVVIRVTSDCPLFDASVLEEMLSVFLKGQNQNIALDYLSNTLTRAYPRGLDAEIFTFSALQQAYKNAHASYEREHVTPYIYQHPELFHLQNFGCDQDHSSHRWTLDTEEDWMLISKVYEYLYSAGQIFSTEQVLGLLSQHPELVLLNADVEQKKLTVSL